MAAGRNLKYIPCLQGYYVFSERCVGCCCYTDFDFLDSKRLECKYNFPTYSSPALRPGSASSVKKAIDLRRTLNFSEDGF